MASKRKSAPRGKNSIPPPAANRSGTGGGIGCSEVLSRLRFPPSLAARHRGQTTHKAGKEQRERLPGEPPAAPVTRCPDTQMGPGSQTPPLWTPPAQAEPEATQGPSPNHLAMASVTPPWVSIIPLELGAHGDGRNALTGSTTLPANKRSKLGGAEPAGGIWQLTCHFVRHCSKLISLAESP